MLLRLIVALVLRERPGTTDPKVRHHRSAQTPSTAIRTSPQATSIAAACTLTPVLLDSQQVQSTVVAWPVLLRQGAAWLRVHLNKVYWHRGYEGYFFTAQYGSGQQWCGCHLSTP